MNEQAYTVVGITRDGFTGTMMLFGPKLFFPLGASDTLQNDFTRKKGVAASWVPARRAAAVDPSQVLRGE